MEALEFFLTKYTEGAFIDLVSKQFYRKNKGFKNESNSLMKEFFKHGGHLTDWNFGVLA